MHIITGHVDACKQTHTKLIFNLSPAHIYIQFETERYRAGNGGVEFSFDKEGNGIANGVLRCVKSYYRCCCGHDDLICFVQIQVWHPGQLREVQRLNGGDWRFEGEIVAEGVHTDYYS
jgi:hypothetical protein